MSWRVGALTRTAWMHVHDLLFGLRKRLELIVVDVAVVVGVEAIEHAERVVHVHLDAELGARPRELAQIHHHVGPGQRQKRIFVEFIALRYHKAMGNGVTKETTAGAILLSITIICGPTTASSRAHTHLFHQNKILKLLESDITPVIDINGVEGFERSAHV